MKKIFSSSHIVSFFLLTACGGEEDPLAPDRRAEDQVTKWAVDSIDFELAGSEGNTFDGRVYFNAGGADMAAAIAKQAIAVPASEMGFDSVEMRTRALPPLPADEEPARWVYVKVEQDPDGELMGWRADYAALGTLTYGLDGELLGDEGRVPVEQAGLEPNPVPRADYYYNFNAPSGYSESGGFLCANGADADQFTAWNSFGEGLMQLRIGGTTFDEDGYEGPSQNGSCIDANGGTYNVRNWYIAPGWSVFGAGHVNCL